MIGLGPFPVPVQRVCSFSTIVPKCWAMAMLSEGQNSKECRQDNRPSTQGVEEEEERAILSVALAYVAPHSK